MAIESERLLAIFEAKFDSLEKALRKARTNAQTAFDGIGAAGRGAEDVLAGLGKRGAPGLDRMTKSAKVLQGQTGNLAAQFNDIGVQLASGTSPFLIAIQQGSQINQVLGQSGARGAVSALGGAFMSMINPVSLATFAIIGLGGAAVQYFASMLSDGDAANASLKEQASAIKQVADKWGAALPAVKAYSDELERQKEAAERLAATQLTITHLFEGTATAVSDVYAKMATLTGSASDLSAFQDGFTAAQIAMRQFEDALKDGKATTEQYETVNDDLTKLLGIDAVQANTALAASIDNLRSAYANAAKAAGLLVAQQQSLAGLPGNQQLPTLGQIPPVYSGGGKFENEQDVLNDRANATKSQFQIEQEKLARRGRRGGGGGSRQNDYQRETEQIEKRTAALTAQTAAQATVNPLVDDFGLALETARAKQQLLSAAQQAGLTITPELTASIDALAGRYGEAYAASQKLAKGQDDARRSAEELNEVARDTFGTFVSDLLHGKSAAEALSDALGRLADRVLDLALDSIFGTGRGGGGGLFGGLIGILGSIFHKGGVAGGSVPSRAVSPAVFAGAPRYHSGTAGAGLRSDEVPAILQRGEVVLPKNTKIAAGGSETITINLQTDQGLIADVADQRIKTHSGAIVHVAVTQAKNQVVPTMAAYQRDRAGGDYRG